MAVYFWFGQLKMRFEFIIAHQTIKEIVTCSVSGCNLYFLQKSFKKLRKKLRKKSENTEYVSLPVEQRDILWERKNKTPTFLNTHQLFNSFFLFFYYHHLYKCITKMEYFSEIVSQMKCYKIKKSLVYDLIVRNVTNTKLRKNIVSIFPFFKINFRWIDKIVDTLRSHP